MKTNHEASRISVSPEPLRDEELSAVAGGKRSTPAATTLLRKCATGTHFPEVTLTA